MDKEQIINQCKTCDVEPPAMRFKCPECEHDTENENFAKDINVPRKNKYNIIYADPPWEYKESGGGHRGTAGLPYATMNIEAIKSLPVHQICADKCILFLWVTFPRLEQGIEVINAWGFKYYGLGFNWIKTTKNGNPFWGMGYYTRQNPEVCLIGVPVDKSKRLKPVHRDVLSVVHSVKGRHSEKPYIIRNLIVRAVGDLPRIELFAREKVTGWDVWGNEVASDIDLLERKGNI